MFVEKILLEHTKGRMLLTRHKPTLISRVYLVKMANVILLDKKKKTIFPVLKGQ
jgi:hypothetical protein